MEFIIAQILGLIALILVCVGYFVKKHNTFLTIQIIANIFYAGAFLVLKNFAAGIITVVSIIRCIYLSICEKFNFKYTIHFLPIFFVCYITLGIIFWQSWFDIIPIITAIMFTIGFYIKNLQLMRYILIAPNALLVFYCIMSRTYTSALLDFIEILVLIFAIIKFNKQKKIIKN